MRNEYLKPEIEIHHIKETDDLLSASKEPTTDIVHDQYSDDEALSKRRSVFLDDDDYWEEQ